LRHDCATEGDPQLCDRARPGYPDALSDDLGGLAQIGPGARVAEVGPGTGQATVTLAAGGAHVVAIEPGAGLADLLRRKVEGSSVEVLTSTFEDWRLPRTGFDTLAAFTSWHWLDPSARAAKAARALRTGGTLAAVTSIHVLGGTEAFFVDVQDCYEQRDPSAPAGLRLPSAGAVAPVVDEVDDCALFLPAGRRRYSRMSPTRRAPISSCWAPTRATGPCRRRRERPS